MQKRKGVLTNQVLLDCVYVVKHSKNVSIDEQKLDEFCIAHNQQISAFTVDDSVFDLRSLGRDQRLNLGLVFNSLNFCFWGEPKWHFNNDKTLGGSVGLMTALKKALEMGKPVTDADFLAQLDSKQFTEMLGSETIPLFKERVRILNEVGGVLKDRFDGSFYNMLRSYDDAVKLAEGIATEFPSFEDSSTYKGRKIRFLKRAQLLAYDVSADKEVWPKGLADVDKLTAFADYKIPLVLRRFGILCYSKGLEEKIDHKIELASGSEEEVEIRAGMVIAVDRIRRVLENRFDKSITAPHIDNYLWWLGQEKRAGEYGHLTRTITY